MSAELQLRHALVNELNELEGTHQMQANKERLVRVGTSASIRRAIDRLDISEEWRVRLKHVARVALKVGRSVHRVGSRIIRAIVRVAKEYPNTSTVAVIGGVLTFASSTVPLLGPVLSPVIATLSIIATAFTFVVEALRKAGRALIA